MQTVTPIIKSLLGCDFFFIQNTYFCSHFSSLPRPRERPPNLSRPVAHRAGGVPGGGRRVPGVGGGLGMQGTGEGKGKQPGRNPALRDSRTHVAPPLRPAPRGPPRDPAAIFLPGGHSGRRHLRPTAQALPRAQAQGLARRAAGGPGLTLSRCGSWGVPGVPGSGRARSGDPWPRLARVGRGRRSLRWEAASRVIPSSRAPFRPSCPLLQPAARPPRGHVDAGLVWPRRPGGGLGAEPLSCPPGGRANSRTRGLCPEGRDVGKEVFSGAGATGSCDNFSSFSLDPAATWPPLS